MKINSPKNVTKHGSLDNPKRTCYSIGPLKQRTFSITIITVPPFGRESQVGSESLLIRDLLSLICDLLFLICDLLSPVCDLLSVVIPALAGWCPYNCNVIYCAPGLMSIVV